MEKLISIAVALGFLTVASGKLPFILQKVRISQIKLLQESQASRWPKTMTLPSKKNALEILRSQGRFDFICIYAPN